MAKKSNIAFLYTLGGVTPSYGLVEEVVKRFKGRVEIHVLIRPRPGDFAYSDCEFEVMLRDILRFKQLGVDGVVVGVLTYPSTSYATTSAAAVSDTGYTVDVLRMKVIREITQGISLTFHRAFDVCSGNSK